MEFAYCKLEIFIPESHLRALQQALADVDAGHIGKYDCCLSYSPVTGAGGRFPVACPIWARSVRSAKSPSSRSK